MSVTNCIALDCEMVGGAYGENLAARVTLVNEHGQVLIDEYIKPDQAIADYRTRISGITARHLESAKSLQQVKPKVQQIINGRILVGHSLDGDLEALGIQHPVNMRRDLAVYQPYRDMNGGQPAALKFLAQRILGRRIQEGYHSSKEDATAAMDIYLARKW